MANPRGNIGDPGLLPVLRMGLRQRGVTIPDVMEAFGVSKDSARRYVMRLLREGKLVRTGERRLRTEIYERPRGAGGFVYRTRENLRNTVYTRRGPRRRRRG